MVEKEYKSEFGTGEVGYAEHSMAARSKKTILGPLTPAADRTSPTALVRSIAIRDLKLNAGINELPLDKSFRCISDQDWYFIQGSQAQVTADAADIFVPAKTAIVLSSREWRWIKVSGAGFIQALEVK